ncbi:MAG: serine/threonine-protein kinase, partial [Elusimicrobia bacterium]|nr:serine/threonine-protein kinase [Elusimicrobiota bacterium]
DKAAGIGSKGTMGEAPAGRSASSAPAGLSSMGSSAGGGRDQQKSGLTPRPPAFQQRPPEPAQKLQDKLKQVGFEPDGTASSGPRAPASSHKIGLEDRSLSDGVQDAGSVEVRSLVQDVLTKRSPTGAAGGPLPDAPQLPASVPAGARQRARPAPGSVGSSAARTPVSGGALRWWLLGGLAIAAGAAGVFAGRRWRRRRAAPARAAERPTPGVLADRYWVKKELDADGASVAYEGLDDVTGKRVAIARIRGAMPADELSRRKLCADAAALKRLAHSNVAAVLDIFEEEGGLYVVTERVTGRTLEQTITKGGLSIAEARDVFRQLASALDYAHAHGAFHGRLKPSEIVFEGDGLPRVTQFGVFQVAQLAAAARGAAVVVPPGAFLCAAPEQEEGKTCAQSDVYALAVCLYATLTGHPPFSGHGEGLSANKRAKAFSSAYSVVMGRPTSLDPIFERAFEPDPAKRHQSAGKLVLELDRLVA